MFYIFTEFNILSTTVPQQFVWIFTADFFTLFSIKSIMSYICGKNSPSITSIRILGGMFKDADWLTADFHSCRFYFRTVCHAIICTPEHIFINNSVQYIVTARHDIENSSVRLWSSKNNWTSRQSFSLISFLWKFWHAAWSCFSTLIALLGTENSENKKKTHSFSLSKIITIIIIDALHLNT